jgi:hypothetical protein
MMKNIIKLNVKDAATLSKVVILRLIKTLWRLYGGALGSCYNIDKIGQRWLFFLRVSMRLKQLTKTFQV